MAPMWSALILLVTTASLTCFHILSKKHFYKTSNSSENMNLMKAIKPLYVIVSLLGLFPYSVKFPKDKQSATLIRKTLYFNCVSCIFLQLIFWFFYIIHVQQVFAQSNTMTVVLTAKINYILELSNLVICCAVSYCCAFRNRFIYVNIINKIISSSNQFVERDRIKSFKYVQDHVRIVIGSLGVTLVCQLLINFTRTDGIWKKVLVTFTFIAPQMIQFVVIGFLHTTTIMVVVIMKNINQEIGKLGMMIVNESGKVERVIGLRQLERVLVEVLEVKRQINEAFQAVILVSALQIFHSLVSEAHIIYHGLFLDGTPSLHDTVHCLSWIAYQLMKIFAISYSGDIIKLQIQELGRCLFNIPTDKFDIRLLMDIQHFASLISHQSEGLWHVYGFIPLDYTLVFNMSASAVMYLTILVQFDKNIS